MARCSSRARAHSGAAFAEPCSAARARAHETPGACLRHVTTKVRFKLMEALGQGNCCPHHLVRFSSAPRYS